MASQEEREFANSAMPVNWYEVAKLLHENAVQLHTSRQGYVVRSVNGKAFTRPASNRSVFLLAAFALENLIKAFLIYENPNFIEGGTLSRALRSHRLSTLQKKCKWIPSPKRTLHVFETLEVGVNSWARYPCSLSASQETDELIVTPEFWSEYNEYLNFTVNVWNRCWPRIGKDRSEKYRVLGLGNWPNKAKHGDSFFVAASPSLQSCPCWLRYVLTVL